MALATNATPGTVHLNGDIHTSNDAQLPELTPTGVKTGTYNFPHVVVDQKGRILSIIEATINDVPCATASSCGIAKIGNTLKLAGSPIGLVDMYTAELISGNNGVVQIGDGITVNNGLISIQSNIATAGSPGTLGVVQVGSGLGIDAAGVLSRGNGNATTFSKGLVQIGNNISVSNGIISSNIAENTTYGLVKSNDTNNISISSGDIDVGSNVSLKSVYQQYTASQNSLMQTITNAVGTIDLDASVYDVFDITTNGNLLINSITNMSTHQQVDIIIRLGNLIAEDTLTLNSSFFKISGNQISGHTTLITCMQITDGGNKAYTIVQPYMQ